jgi:putative DNA primase/helicase
MFEITGGDGLLARYLQAAAGYTLTGSTEAHRAFLLVGGGSNGKSVFLAVLQHVMGDYATTADKHVILETKNEQHPASLAALEGARMVVVPELPDGRRLDSDRFKALVGGDEVSARLMRQNPRTFRPKAKLWITTNSLPRVADDSDGMWRRIVPVPFTVSFTGSLIDYDLEAKLKAEAPGILAWMLDGLRIYREEGLVEPACIQAIKGEYRRAEDEIAEFREELEFEDEPTTQLSSSRMYEAYAQWAKRRGYRPITQNNLSRRLKAHGVTPTHLKHCNAYIGWRLRGSSITSSAVIQDDIDAD